MEDPRTTSGGGRPDGKRRWKTLSHRGVLLPEPYRPHGRPVVWRATGAEVRLPPVAEEMITEFVRRGGRAPSTGPPTLFGRAGPAAAFWGDWRAELPASCPIRSLAGCDLSRVAEAAMRMNVRARPRGTPPQATATVDGRPQPVSPFAVDRPGIFSGRNASAALSGRYRRRLTAADVTLNLGPVSTGKRRWGGVVSDPTVDWIAKWRDPLTGVVKYARLSPASSGEQVSDRTKHETARSASEALPALRRRTNGLLSNGADARGRQLGACLWLVDRLALRPGTGGDDGAARAGAFGAATLQVGHVKTGAKGGFTLDFPGKDGVRYLRSVPNAPEAVTSALRDAGRGKAASSPLFDLITSEDVNREISAAIPGATARVLRTAHASAEFRRALDEDRTDDTRLALLRAGARVAALCNHRVRGRGYPGTGYGDLRELETAIDRASHDVRALAGIVRSSGLSLATSRANYVDPRIAAGYLARRGVAPERAFPASLRKRFKWAIDEVSAK